MSLLVTTLKTPVGNLNLLANDQILIGANLSTISAFKAGKDIKVVKSIPVISDLIDDYKYVDGVHFNERKHWLNDDYVKFLI